MKITIEDLPQKLSQHLSPIYLVTGDEALLVQEASDSIKTAALAADFTNRESYTADRHFKWETLTTSSSNLSLFGNKTLIELNLPTGKPGTQGSKYIKQFCELSSPDTILLIRSSKLESTQLKSAWVQAIEKHGHFLPIWPLNPQALLGWIQQRLQQYELQADEQTIQLIANTNEGNLLAIDQECQKLQLLFTTGKLTLEAVQACLTDNARYTVYQFTDAMLAGERKRLIKILPVLKAEGIDPTIILWAITRELNHLISLASLNPPPSDHDFMRLGIWHNRRHLMKQSLKRHHLSDLLSLLPIAERLDHTLKGVYQANAWDELLNIGMSLA